MVGRLARKVRERYRRMDLAFRPGRYGPAVVRELAEHTTDLGIARFEQAPPGVQSRAVASEHGVLAVPSGHRVAGAGVGPFRRPPRRALHHAAGSLRLGRPGPVRLWLSRGGLVPDIVQTAPDSWTCVALVAAGVGLHFTTDSAVRQMILDGVRLVPLADEMPPVFSYLLWRTGDQDPALRNVLGLSEQVLPTVP